MVAKLLLPGTEFGVKLTSNEFVFNHQSISNDLTSRTQIFGGGSFGLVDLQDPSLVTSTDTARPFHIGANAEDPLALDVNAGVVFMPSGHFIQLDNKQTRIPLASLTLGTINVVFIEYRLLDSDDTRITRFNAKLPVRHERPTATKIVQVTTLTDFNDLNKFNLDRLNNIVLIGIITVVAGSTVEKELEIDLGKVTFTNNRPWFSLRDNQHRASVGTGSTDVPHALGLNDLSAGDLTLYQQFLQRGITLSKDQVKARLPGSRLCSQVIDNTAWKIDAGGTFTKGSQFNSKTAFYTELSTFPSALVSAYETADKNNSIAGEIVPHTNIFVLAPSEDVLNLASITVFYLETQAAMPSPAPVNNEIFYASPAKGELLISSGLAFTALTKNSLSFKNSGTIPSKFRVFLDKNKDFVVNPQILLPQTSLNSLGSVETKLVTTQYTAGFIQVGLTKAIIASTLPLSIKLELKGTDLNGSPLIEEVEFTSSWQDVPVPGIPNPKQIVTSTNIFLTVDSIRLTNRQNDGAASEIIVYVDLKPFQDGTKFNELNLISSIAWDGSTVARIFDERIIKTNLDITQKVPALGVEAETINSVFNAEYSVTEDFRGPLLQDSEFSELEKYTEGLNVPVRDEVDTTGITIQKYRSRAIGIRSFGIPIQELAFVIHRATSSQEINPKSMRARFAGIGEFATGTLTVISSALLNDQETLTLNDGVRTVVFEFDKDNLVTGSNIQIDLSVITTVEEVRDACIAAINSSPLNIQASIKNSSQINLQNLRRSSQGNTTSSNTILNSGFSVTNMQNGVSEAWTPWEILAQNLDQKSLFSKDFIKNIGKFQFEIFGEAVGVTLFFKDRTKAFLPSFGGGSGGGGGSSFFYDRRVMGDGFSLSYTLPNNQTYKLSNNSLLVFVNGLKLSVGDDYTEVEDVAGFGTKVTFLTPPAFNSKINFRLKSLLPGTTYDERVIADGIATFFTLPLAQTYAVGRNTLEVFVNGAKRFLGDDYVELDAGSGDGTQIVFITPPISGAKINFRIES